MEQEIRACKLKFTKPAMFSLSSFIQLHTQREFFSFYLTPFSTANCYKAIQPPLSHGPSSIKGNDVYSLTLNKIKLTTIKHVLFKQNP